MGRPKPSLHVCVCARMWCAARRGSRALLYRGNSPTRVLEVRDIPLSVCQLRTALKAARILQQVN